MFSPLSSPPPAADDAVKDVSLATFKADVLEASKQALVLVDFWATWCGPCKQLTPILEKVARASKGTIKLAKIDVDQNQPLAQQMGVQSVPSVFAFYAGRPVDGFAGALSEAQVKTWVEQQIAKTGAPTGDEKAGLDTALQQAADFMAAGDIATARAIYTDILDMEPMHGPSYAGLMLCFLKEGETQKARELLEAASPEMQKDKALTSVRAALELAEQAGMGDVNAIAELEKKCAQNPLDHESRYALAMALYALGQREQAVDHLLEIVKKARTWNEDAARKQLVKFFEAFGPTDPLTLSARKRLSAILFA
jgi:putative thioredoxin